MIRFNLARFLCRFIYWSIATFMRAGWALSTLPMRIGYRIAALTLGALAFTTVKPAARAIKNTFFKEPPPKRYMKVGKPATPRLSVSIENRPVAITVPVEAPIAYAYRTRESNADLVKRNLAQRQAFIVKFQSSIVQVG